MTTATQETIFCEKHPTRETRLRCNRCGKPICSSCAVQTPTGYRCEDCVRGQQKKFDTAEWYDYPLAIGTAFTLAAIGSLFVNVVGFFILFIAPTAGVVIAEIVRRIVRRRRSKLLFRLVPVAVVVGGLLPHVPLFLVVLLGGGLGGFFSLLWPLIYVAMATSAVYYRLAGIQLRL